MYVGGAVRLPHCVCSLGVAYSAVVVPLVAGLVVPLVAGLVLGVGLPVAAVTLLLVVLLQGFDKRFTSVVGFERVPGERDKDKDGDD